MHPEHSCSLALCLCGVFFSPSIVTTPTHGLEMSHSRPRLDQVFPSPSQDPIHLSVLKMKVYAIGNTIFLFTRERKKERITQVGNQKRGRLPKRAFFYLHLC